MLSLALKVGKRILFYRKNLGVSQEKFAEMVGLNRTYIGKLELGIQIPTIATIEKITKSLNISFCDFFDGL